MKPRMLTSFGNTIVRRGDVVTKRSGDDPARLLREAEWLRRLPAAVAGRFARVLAVRAAGDRVEYDMPFYPGPSLLDRLVSSRFDLDAACATLIDVCEFVDATLHPVETAARQPDLIDRIYAEKLRARMAQVAGRASAFRAICGAPMLMINGRPCRQPLDSWDRMTQAVCRDTPRTARVHGDLKPDNILADAEGFVLIDPRGGADDGRCDADPLEDFAKLRTTTSAWYDVARHGLIHLSVDGTAVNWRWQPAARQPIKRLRYADARLLTWLAERSKRHGDALWRPRLDAITGLLLAANAPVHLPPDGDLTAAGEALALYLYCEGALRLQQTMEAIGC